MGICKECGQWHSSKECPPAKKVTCSCGNSFTIPADCIGLLGLITCANCLKSMDKAKVE